MPTQFLPGPLDKLLIVFFVSYSVPNLDKVIKIVTVTLMTKCGEKKNSINNCIHSFC